MENDTIDPLGKPIIGQVLVDRGRIVPTTGERLGCDKRLSIHMSRGCSHAYIHIVFQWRMHPAEPELGHRNLHFAFGQQGIFEDLHRDARRLGIDTHSLLPEQGCHCAVVSFCDQVRNGSAKVP